MKIFTLLVTKEMNYYVFVVPKRVIHLQLIFTFHNWHFYNSDGNENAFTNLKDLDKVLIQNCGVPELRPGAFNNMSFVRKMALKGK